MTNYHAANTASWVVGGETLTFLTTAVGAGDRTLEIGAGASTVIFASAGTRHTAISPFADEHDAIRNRCRADGVDLSCVDFVVESSDEALPGLARSEAGLVDLVLIDGDHTFPATVVDFHYANMLLRIGGILLLDDAPMGSVKIVHRFMHGNPDWEYIGVYDARAVAYRKVGIGTSADEWASQKMNRRYPDFWYLPLADRAKRETRAYGSRLKSKSRGVVSRFLDHRR